MPGDNVSIGVKLTAPIAMDEGRHFAIREGGRTLIGAGNFVRALYAKLMARYQEKLGVERFAVPEPIFGESPVEVVPEDGDPDDIPF